MRPTGTKERRIWRFNACLPRVGGFVVTIEPWSWRAIRRRLAEGLPPMRQRGIPASKWVWCGYAGHFVGASSCRLHLHTRVGDYRISTVGDYRPEHRGGEREPIGAGPDANFETFVFRVSGEGQHGEGEVDDWGEIDSERYAEAEDAERGHMDYCRKYAAIAAQDLVRP